MSENPYFQTRNFLKHFWTSADIYFGFQSQAGSFICMLYHLCAIDSSVHLWYDTCLPPDGQHGSWSFFYPRTFTHIIKQESLYLRIPKTQEMKTNGREGKTFFAHPSDPQHIQFKINFEFSFYRFGTRISWRRMISSEKRLFPWRRSTLRQNQFTRRGTPSKMRSVSRSKLQKVMVNVENIRSVSMLDKT